MRGGAGSVKLSGEVSGNVSEGLSGTGRGEAAGAVAEAGSGRSRHSLR